MERREFLRKSVLTALGTAVAGTGLVQAFTHIGNNESKTGKMRITVLTGSPRANSAGKAWARLWLPGYGQQGPTATPAMGNRHISLEKAFRRTVQTRKRSRLRQGRTLTVKIWYYEHKDTYNLICPADGGSRRQRHQREMITCVTLATMQTLPQLKAHAGAALNVGVTPVELREAMYLTAPFIGFPRMLNAVGTVNEVFRERGISLPLEN